MKTVNNRGQAQALCKESRSPETDGLASFSQGRVFSTPSLPPSPEAPQSRCRWQTGCAGSRQMSAQQYGEPQNDGGAEGRRGR